MERKSKSFFSKDAKALKQRDAEREKEKEREISVNSRVAEELEREGDENLKMNEKSGHFFLLF